MSVIDLHPEELFDKEMRGELTAGERERLDDHLVRCKVCRLERAMRADFSDELASDPHPSALLGLVQGALAARPPAPPPEPEVVEAPVEERPRRRRVRPAVFWLAAAALLVAGVASAAGVAQPAWTRLRTTVDTVLTPTPEASLHLPPPEVVSHGARPSVPEAVPVLTSSDVPVVRPLEVAPVPVTTAPAVVAPAPISPERMASRGFDTANDARRRGDVAGALAAYRALQARHGNSPEAQVSRAIVGRMLLDSGDFRGALASYDAYLAKGAGSLREEALAGRAEALERLGRGRDENAAWEALLLEYPSSAFAAHARRRLEASSER